MTNPPSSRHPFELFMLALCVIAGLPMIFGSPAPTSIQALMPSWAVVTWGILLTGGAAVALIGCWLPNRLTGILVEQVGLVATGVGAVIYGLCALIVVGLDGLIGCAIIIGFGASCLWRWVQLQHIIAAAKGSPEHAARFNRGGRA